jgi:hypothetical protein
MVESGTDVGCKVATTHLAFLCPVAPLVDIQGVQNQWIAGLEPN